MELRGEPRLYFLTGLAHPRCKGDHPLRSLLIRPKQGGPGRPFVFYIVPYLLSNRMGCLSGCLVSFASIQKLFCES